MKKKEYEKHGCEFLNESDCSEELEESGLNPEEAEEEYFENE
jgi:hypothetical protein